MFKDFIGKEVKIVLSTNSRPAIGTGSNAGVYVTSGVINAFGILKETDDKFLKFEKFRYTITKDFTVATTIASGFSQGFF